MSKLSSQIVFVKPAEGARVRQPNRNSRVMPPEGDRVSIDDVYYNRLITSGDLLVQQEQPAKPQPKADPKPRE